MTKVIYRTIRVLPLIFVVLCLALCTKATPKTVHYAIAKRTADSISSLEITMKFKADPSGITKLIYADDAWGENDLFNCISNLKALHSEASFEMNKDSGWILVHHPKKLKELKIQYSLKQDFKEEGNRGESYRPIVQEAYFHVFSHNMFMMPEHLAKDGNDTLDVEIIWDSFPEDFTLHNSFGTKKEKQHLKNIPLHEFHTAIFVGGDYRILHDTIDGNDIYLANRGDWIPFKDSTIMEILSKTMKVQRDFWKDHSQEYFTVTMRPISQERGSSFQGTGLTNSFATSISNNEYTDIEQLVYLFNHELQHNWIGHTIENSNEEEQYWFSEGFTEYYTLKNIAKNRINNLGASYFINKMNEIIRNLHSSPVSEAPNSEINYENFWSDRDYGKLPYYRGALFAFYLDQRIISDSDGKYSLDNVMHELHRNALERKKNITHDYFVSITNKYLNGDISSFFRKHIEEGKSMPLAEIFSNIGLEYEPTATVFDLGFELSGDQGEVVTVTEGSAAHRAGLRVGDKIGSRSIYYGSTEQPVELGIIEGTTQKKLSFHAVKVADIPQLYSSPRNQELIKY